MKFLVQNQPCYAYTGGKPFDADKPALLFIHGAANDHSVWHLQSRYFAHHGWNVMAVDLPGHGRSPGPVRARIRDYAQWVIAFLDNANIRSAVLVGHSMGSLIALDCALTAPERIARLVLIGASVPMPVSDVLLDAAQNALPAAHDMLVTWGHGPRTRLGTSPIPGVSVAGTYRRLLARAAPGVLHADLEACARYSAPAEALAAMNVPALLCIGERDQMTPPRASLALLKSLPNARSFTVPDAGHGTMYESPDAVLGAMKDFLARMPSQA